MKVPCDRLCTAVLSIRQGLPLDILIFLLVLPEIVKAELPGTHIGWLALLIHTLPKNPSSLIENCWPF